MEIDGEAILNWGHDDLFDHRLNDLDGFLSDEGPRNQLNLHNRKVALFERPVSVCGHGEDSSEIAAKIDIQLTLAVRGQGDLVHQRADLRRQG